MSTWRRRSRWLVIAVVLLAAAPLPVTAAGILLAEQGSAPLPLAVLAVTILTAAACLAGGVTAARIAVGSPGR